MEIEDKRIEKKTEQKIRPGDVIEYSYQGHDGNPLRGFALIIKKAVACPTEEKTIYGFVDLSVGQADLTSFSSHQEAYWYDSMKLLLADLRSSFDIKKVHAKLVIE